MAWTAPRTWVTAEVVTAALMNTHLRDNLLETSTAKVTTAGDLTYATGATALSRLAIGTANQFLVGGASAPAWANTINALTILGAAPDIRLQDTGAADTNDFWRFLGNDELLRVARFDDSASVNVDSMQLAQGDFILHSGDKGQDQGAVVIGTDTATTGNLTTSGTKTMDITGIVTGGPAYVLGHWSLKVAVQTGATPAGTITILPRNDGTNIAPGEMSTTDYQLSRVGLAADEDWWISGSFFERHTSTDTSDYELFVVAETNSEWETIGGNMHVISIQYPT